MREAEYDIRIEGVSQYFRDKDGGERVLYRDVSLGVPRGELFVLLGRNGVGKSTLLKTIAGINPIQSGSVIIGGEPLGSLMQKKLAEKVSFVSTEIIKVRDLSVWDVVSMGRSPYTGWMGNLCAEDKNLVRRAIDMVGMAGFSAKGIDSLSDGERQRVMIARALAQDAGIIILDEPTAFLDVPNKFEIALLLRRLAHDHGKTVVFSTHDLSIALRLADTVCVMNHGEFFTGAPEDMVLAGHIGDMFAGTSLVYDMSDADIKIRSERKGGVSLDAPPHLYGLMERALERAGYAVADDGGGRCGLKVLSDAGGIAIDLERNGEVRRFGSVGAMMRFLKDTD